MFQLLHTYDDDRSQGSPDITRTQSQVSSWVSRAWCLSVARRADTVTSMYCATYVFNTDWAHTLHVLYISHTPVYHVLSSLCLISFRFLIFSILQRSSIKLFFTIGYRNTKGEYSPNNVNKSREVKLKMYWGLLIVKNINILERQKN